VRLAVTFLGTSLSGVRKFLGSARRVHGKRKGSTASLNSFHPSAASASAPGSPLPGLINCPAHADGLDHHGPTPFCLGSARSRVNRRCCDSLPRVFHQIFSHTSLNWPQISVARETKHLRGSHDRKTLFCFITHANPRPLVFSN
jgi:hypothetical protein